MKLHSALKMFLGALVLAATFITGQHFSPTVVAQSHQKWEYQIVGSNGFSNSGQIKKINELGEDGWEAVTLNAHDKVLLRRPK